MKKIILTLTVFLLVACSTTETDEAAPAPQRATESPAQQAVAGDNTTQTESPSLTKEEAMTIIGNLIESLRNATYEADYDTTIEALQKAWAPYVTDTYFNEVSTNFECEMEYCGAFYYFPNSFDFGWRRTVDFVSEDYFTTSAIFSNLGDSLYFTSNKQQIDVRQEDGAWKIDNVEFTEQAMNLTADEVIAYLAETQNIVVDEVIEDTLPLDGVDYTIYTFLDPETGEAYFVEAGTGTVYAHALFEVW